MVQVEGAAAKGRAKAPGEILAVAQAAARAEAQVWGLAVAQAADRANSLAPGDTQLKTPVRMKKKVFLKEF